MPGKTKRSTIGEMLFESAEELQPQKITCAADKDIGLLEAEILLAHVLKRDRAWLIAHAEMTIRTTELKRFRLLISRRKKHEPIAYILGEKEFYGLPFRVNPSVLIPRPESELLVDLVRNARASSSQRTNLIWEVGTGSGAIALALGNHLQTTDILATDISKKALVVAKQNAKRLGITNVTFGHGDLLDKTTARLLQKLQPDNLIIVANLPYLPQADKKKLMPDVIKYEPASALFAGKDGAALIQKLLQQLITSGLQFSSAFFEYDPPQTKQLKTLTHKLFPMATIRTHQDLAGRDRVLEIIFEKKPI